MLTKILRDLACGAFVSCICVGAAHAQAAGDATALPPVEPTAPAVVTPGPLAPGFLVSPTKLPDSQLRVFIAAPAALLAQNPAGGEAMTSTVRALAGSTADALQPLLSLVSSANAAQIASIGSGLGRAAASAAPINPTYAAAIQAAVLELKNPALEVAFAGGTPPEDATAALGGGAAPGGAAAAGIGAGGASNGGLNSTLGNAGGTDSGTSAFSAGATNTRFFASNLAGAVTINQVSSTTPPQQ